MFRLTVVLKVVDPDGREEDQNQGDVKKEEDELFAHDADGAGLTEGAIYWHLKQIYQKLPISLQVDLVRLVLSIAEVG